MNERVRKIDFYPADWTEGIAGHGLGAAAVGVYIQLIALCTAAGRATLAEDETVRRIAALFGDRRSTIQGAVDRLVAAGKVTRNGGDLEPKRVRSELERASNRLRQARDAAASSWRSRRGQAPVSSETSDLTHAVASQRAMPTTNNHQPSTNSNNSGGGGRVVGSSSSLDIPPPAPKPQTLPPGSDMRLGDRIMDVTGWRNEAACHDAGRTLQLQGYSPETVIAAAKLVAPGVQPDRPAKYLAKIIAARNLGPVAAAPASRFTPEEQAEIVRFNRDCERAERKGLRPGVPGYPKRSDYRFRDAA